MTIIKILPSTLLAFSLSSCGSNGQSVKVSKTNGFQQSHGPFDANGNYVEKWADSPPKRRFITSKRPGRSKASPKKTSEVAKTTKKTYTPPQKTYTPPKPTKTTYTPPKKTYTPPKKTTAKTTKKAYVAPKKAAPKKITPKAKAPIIHRVVKGDTLYGLSRKYGASISAIQTANGLRGNSISLGANLIIPRK